MERGNLLQLARRFWLIIIAGAVIGGVAAHVAAGRMQPTYEATVSLLVGPINADFDTQRAAGNLGRTYSDLATSSPILRKTIRAAHAKTNVLTLRKNVTATSNDITRIVTIQVKDSDRAVAARLANALADALRHVGSATSSSVVESFMTDPAITDLPPSSQDAIRTLAVRLFGSGSAGKLSIVDPAEAPAAPVAPRVTLLTGLGVVGGLLIACLLVFVRASTTSKIDAEDELPETEGLRLLGRISGDRKGGLVFADGKSSDAADAYRLLAAKVGFAQNGRPIRSLLVVDGGDGESSGTTAANLAAALREHDTRVALVDANTVTGEVTKLLGLDGNPGYADVLAENGRLNEIDSTELPLQEAEDMAVLPHGTGDGHVGIELERAQRLIDLLHEQADMVVVNGPPADRSSSALIWARSVDATLFVVERRKTKRDTIENAMSSLSLAGGNVIGTIFRS